MSTARMNWPHPLAPGVNSGVQPASAGAALVEALAGGSREALATAYRLHAKPVFGLAYALTASREAADEVLQETFLLLLREPRKYDPAKGSLGAFLMGVARQLSRKARVGRTALSVDESEFGADAEDPAALDALDNLIARQDWQHLHEALATLPDAYREALVLHHFEELSYEQIADEMKCAIGTVRSRLARAREMLARKVAGRRGRESAAGATQEQPIAKGGSANV